MTGDQTERSLRIRLEGRVEALEGASRLFGEASALLTGKRWREHASDGELLNRVLAVHMELGDLRRGLLRFQQRENQAQEKLLKRILKDSSAAEERLGKAAASVLAMNGEGIDALPPMLERLQSLAKPLGLAAKERVLFESEASITALSQQPVVFGPWYNGLFPGSFICAPGEARISPSDPKSYRGKLRLTQERLLYEDASRAVVFLPSSAHLLWDPGDDDLPAGIRVHSFLLQMRDPAALALRWPILHVTGFPEAMNAWAEAGYPKVWPPKATQ